LRYSRDYRRLPYKSKLAFCLVNLILYFRVLLTFNANVFPPMIVNTMIDSIYSYQLYGLTCFYVIVDSIVCAWTGAWLVTAMGVISRRPTRRVINQKVGMGTVAMPRILPSAARSRQWTKEAAAAGLATVAQ
jgi:hypothetical protein